MKLPHSVCEVLRDHVVLESECIDRMYLNVYVPQLQRIGGVVWYLRGHLGQRFASTAGVAPKTDAFVANIERFVADQGVEMVSFAKHQRKDDVTQQYLQQFDADEGVLYVGRAQEKARVVRTERRRSATTGATYPWVVDGSAMVNHFYFYCVDWRLRSLLPEVLLVLPLQRQAVHQRQRVRQVSVAQARYRVRGAGQRRAVLR